MIRTSWKIHPESKLQWNIHSQMIRYSKLNKCFYRFIYGNTATVCLFCNNSTENIYAINIPFSIFLVDIL
jgi:hypothetical protein